MTYPVYAVLMSLVRTAELPAMTPLKGRWARGVGASAIVRSVDNSPRADGGMANAAGSAGRSRAVLHFAQ